MQKRTKEKKATDIKLNIILNTEKFKKVKENEVAIKAKMRATREFGQNK